MDYRQPDIGRTGFHFLVLGIVFILLNLGGYLLAVSNEELKYFMREFNFFSAAGTVTFFLMIMAFLFSLASLLSKERSKRDVVTIILSLILGGGLLYNMRSIMNVLY